MSSMKRETGKDEMEKIVKVLERYEAQVPHFTRMENLMDLMHCQEGVCVLDLDMLLNASEEDFFHDMNGIKTHFDRKAIALKDGFIPRCIMQEG